MTKSNSPNHQPPRGAPEGTVWFGGPIGRSCATLRIFGSELDPSEISELLGCIPTSSAKTGQVVQRANGKSFAVREGFWRLESNQDCSQIEDHVLAILARLTDDQKIWCSLNTRFKIDMFCGLFLGSMNQGFDLSPIVLKQLSDRGISIGFDIYAPDPPAGEP